MWVSVKQNFKINDIKPIITRSISDSVLLVHSKAIDNAPYKTWTLRGSLVPVMKTLYWTIDSVTPYAVRREYENKKNPDRKFYMKRATDSSIREIENIFEENINEYLITK